MHMVMGQGPAGEGVNAHTASVLRRSRRTKYQPLRENTQRVIAVQMANTSIWHGCIQRLGSEIAQSEEVHERT
ncbi:hypothetical protein E4U19_006556 [Claviceps sp. Clav32 group G5]|nr:hypothetical protein E4U19_006556 [Claviceps sp. Clav32 group G5]